MILKRIGQLVLTGIAIWFAASGGLYVLSALGIGLPGMPWTLTATWTFLIAVGTLVIIDKIGRIVTTKE